MTDTASTPAAPPEADVEAARTAREEKYVALMAEETAKEAEAEVSDDADESTTPAAPKAAPPSPPKADASDEEPPDTESDSDEDEPAEPKAAKPAKGSPRELLDQGDLEGAVATALKEALGDDWDGVEKVLERTKVNSAQWAAWRKKNQEAKRAAEQRKTELEQREAEMSGKFQQAVQRLEPYHQAAEAFKAGDLDAFAKQLGSLTGTGITSFSELTRWGLHKVHGSDPEKETLRRQLQALEQRIEQDKQQQHQAAQEAERQKLQQEYVSGIRAELAEHSDPVIKRLSSTPAFLRRVLDVQREAYHATGVDLPHQEAADAALSRWRDEELGGAVDFTLREADREPNDPAVSVQGGSDPARPGKRKRAPTNLSQKRAAESAGRKPMTPEQRLAYFTRQGELAAAQERAGREAG